MSRAGRAARGAGWVYASRWAERLLGFAGVVVLARLLSPEDFGLVAIATSWVLVIEGLSEFDVRRALVRSREEGRELFDTAWTLALGRGVVASAALLAVAPFAEDRRITWALWALALAPLLDGLANPRFVLFERELVYSRVAAQTLVAALLAFAVTVGLALAYRSYWALIAGAVASRLAHTAVSYLLRPYLPRPSLGRWREILAFSGWMSLANLVTTLSMRTDRILVGRLLGVVEAGYYFMTQRVAVLPTAELVSPLQRVLFASYSEIAADRGRLRAAVAESTAVLATLSLPAACGFALVAERAVPLVLGPGWQTIVPLLWIFVPYLGVRATLSSAQPCVMALGRTRLMFQVSLLYAVVHLPLFVGGTLLYGLRGAVAAIVLAGVFYIALSLWLLRVTVAFGLVGWLRGMWRPLLACGALVAALAAWRRIGAAGDDGWIALLLEVLLGGSVYAAALLALWLLRGRPEGPERRIAAFVGARLRSGGEGGGADRPR